MIFLIFILIALILYKSEINISGFSKNYLNKNITLSIKGIFVFLVFYRHCQTYISLNSMLDLPMVLLDRLLGQSIVAMFLFYSGYGIYEQIKIKKDIYVNSFFKKRILPIFVDFFIAIFSFLIMDICLGKLSKYSLRTIILSFIGFESIGNSNWYMFLIYVLYLFIIISFTIFKKDDKRAIIFIVFLTILYSFIILLYKEQWWMNTSLCFSFGMIYSYYKDKIEIYLEDNLRYTLLFIVFIILYLLLNYIYIKSNNPIIYSIISLFFTALILLLTMKFSVSNIVLIYFEKNVFWVYILQRIPMIVLTEFEINKYPYTFFALCFIITICLTFIYTYVINKIKYIKKEVIE